MGKEVRLKPCPFCGREVTIDSLKVFHGIACEMTIRCKCGVEFELCGEPPGVFETEHTYKVEKLGKDALEIWNERV